MKTLDTTRDWKSFDMANTPLRERFAVLSGGIVPRPIALASTIDKQGRPNLSPFSFFNVFSSNPPILIFSPAKSAKELTYKDTLHNVQEHPEVVVNIVSYAMAEQISLASTTYPRGINEFVKSGLSALSAVKVKPYRVAESPIHFECKVKQIVPLGDEGGAGNLVICEVIHAHVQTRLLNEKGRIEPDRIDAVARLGANWYARIQKQALFEIKKPIHSMGLGVDALPEWVRNEPLFTGNELGKLGGIEELPNQKDLKAFAAKHKPIQRALQSAHKAPKQKALARIAKEYVAAGDIQNAWLTILQPMED